LHHDQTHDLLDAALLLAIESHSGDNFLRVHWQFGSKVPRQSFDQRPFGRDVPRETAPMLTADGVRPCLSANFQRQLLFRRQDRSRCLANRKKAPA
jgi:hypothetical protein